MSRRLDTAYLRTLLQSKGWQQAELAAAVGVTDAAVSQWMNSDHVPRPGTLIKVAVALGGAVEKLLVNKQEVASDQPMVAFRRKGQQITTDFQEDLALDQGYALERLAPYLAKPVFKPREFTDPSTQYEHVEQLAALVRDELNHRDSLALDWPTLVNWFSAQSAVLIPVFWGERENHGNALHIFLPASGHTFVYLNLDSEELDFKFWLAHEMAHMLTPSLVGAEAGEDFADAFAGALLFPQRLAAEAYREALQAKSAPQVLQTLERHATKAGVSLHTVYKQCEALANAKGVDALHINSTRLHQHRRILDRQVGKIRRHFFGDSPSAKDYVSVCEREFRTPFFRALSKHLAASAEGPRYIKRVLHCSMTDAFALHQELQGASVERSAD